MLIKDLLKLNGDIDLPSKLCGECGGKGSKTRFTMGAKCKKGNDKFKLIICPSCQGRGVVLDLDMDKLAGVINLWIGDLFVKSPEGKKLWLCIEDSDRTSLAEAIATRINECLKEGNE